MIARWGPSALDGIRPIVDGGVSSPQEFIAGGVASGVKPSGRPDLAAVVSTRPARVAVMTTTNRVKAPACHLCEDHAADGSARAVIVNAGNANVCAPDDAAHARRIVDAAANQLALAREEVLVMSTGVIGVPLPVERIEAAMPALVEDLDASGGGRAAQAIMTTDTRPKQLAVEVTDGAGGRCVVGGMAKGVGMIEPSMATLLVALTTDAELDAARTRQMLRDSVASTFNRISVDGDRSTSDTAALFANGAAGSVDPDRVAAAVTHVCAELARMVVADGEGASRVAAITVDNAATGEDAEAFARAVATSLLVRAALHGADPNWGRILMALGNAEVALDPSRVTVRCAGTTVCRDGMAVAFDRVAVANAMGADEVEIVIDVAAGNASATVLTCDLTPEYVRFNAEYTT